MASNESVSRAALAPSRIHYGAIVRRISHLCRQVDTFAAPLPPPQAQAFSSQHADALQAHAHRHAGTMPGRQGVENNGRIFGMPRMVLVGGQSTGKS
uniref:Uncharacterized protein n=1 Tax=Melanopsichium pennsylvanicum 4 TaxID=1398559 RepID=A0A077R626_9BASI|nr:uncharacterized protein BN887_04465 [Melanopsichium pennsylvanicum 4]